MPDLSDSLRREKTVRTARRFRNAGGTLKNVCDLLAASGYHREDGTPYSSTYIGSLLRIYPDTSFNRDGNAKAEAIAKSPLHIYHTHKEKSAVVPLVFAEMLRENPALFYITAASWDIGYVGESFLGGWEWRIASEDKEYNRYHSHYPSKTFAEALAGLMTSFGRHISTPDNDIVDVQIDPVDDDDIDGIKDM